MRQRSACRVSEGAVGLDIGGRGGGADGDCNLAGWRGIRCGEFAA